MTNLLSMFERLIVFALMTLMMITVFVSTIELGIILVQQLLEQPMFLLNISEMQEVFGFFLMVLIGLELLESIKTYLLQDKVHVEVVFLVAMVAIARKVIIIDYEDTSVELLLGMSALVFSLSLGYYFVKRALSNE